MKLKNLKETYLIWTTISFGNLAMKVLIPLVPIFILRRLSESNGLAALQVMATTKRPTTTQLMACMKLEPKGTPWLNLNLEKETPVYTLWTTLKKRTTVGMPWTKTMPLPMKLILWHST